MIRTLVFPAALWLRYGLATAPGTGRDGIERNQSDRLNGGHTVYGERGARQVAEREGHESRGIACGVTRVPGLLG
jgi:hypothetical protein